MATIKSTLALEDRMSNTLNATQKAAIQNIQTFNSLSKEVDNLKKSLEQAEKLNPNIVKTAGYSDAAVALERMEVKLYDVAHGTDKFGESVQKNGEKAKLSFVEINQALELVKKGLTVLKKVADISDQYVQTTARLNMINDELQTTKELQDKIFASAQRSRAAYQQTADLVAKISLNAGDAFSSNNETILFAENLNKLFKVSGASQQDIASATLQLNQALGSGVLRGQELNSVFKASPNVIQTIADYLGVPIGQIRKLAEQGKITSDIVKNALLGATDEINKQFENIPMTWADVWTKISNIFLKVAEPILMAINWIANNLDILGPIILSVAAAIAIYTIAVNAATIATNLASAATKIWAGIQAIFNAILALNPIVLIIMAIILLIGVIFAVIAVINKVTGSSINAIGVIMGVLYTLLAFVYNTITVPIQNAFASLVNFLANCFKNPVQSIKILFAEMALWVVNKVKRMVQTIENLINLIPGVKINISAGIDNFSSKLESSIAEAKDAMGWEDIMEKWERKDYGDAYNQGYSFGSNLFKKQEKEQRKFNPKIPGDLIPEDLIGTDGAGGKALKTTSNDNLLSDEDIQLLLDVATRDYKLNYQQVTPEIVVSFGDIRETADVDDVLDQVADRLQEIYDGNLEVS